jgi:hypothetical protein
MSNLGTGTNTELTFWNTTSSQDAISQILQRAHPVVRARAGSCTKESAQDVWFEHVIDGITLTTIIDKESGVASYVDATRNCPMHTPPEFFTSPRREDLLAYAEICNRHARIFKRFLGSFSADYESNSARSDATWFLLALSPDPAGSGSNRSTN